MTLAPRSLKCLTGVHPDLVRVVNRADELGARFHVTCGLRTEEQQKALLAAGKSKTMKSRHLTGHAVDFVVAEADGGVSYEHADMAACAAIIKQAAAECGVPVEWGGDWKSFVDTPHIQLPWKQYPIVVTSAPTISATLQESVSIPAESVPNPPVSPVPPVQPAGPVVRSGTVWGSLGAFGAAILSYMDETFQTLLEAANRLSELAPAQSLIATVAGNTRSLAFSMTAGCLALVIARRIKAKQEGKAG